MSSVPMTTTPDYSFQTNTLSYFFHALRIELFCLRCGKIIWLLLATPVVLVVLQLLLSKLSGVSGTFAGGGDMLSNTANINGYGLVTDGIRNGLIIINLLAIGVAAYGLAYERDIGAIRHSIIRATSRHHYLLAKYVAMLLLVFVAVLLTIGAAFVVGSVLWHFGPVIEDGFELISVAEIHSELIQGVVLALLPLPASVALGLLVSVVDKNATQAVALALGLTLAFDLLKGAINSAAQWMYAFYQPALLDKSYLGEVAKIVRGFSDVLVNENQLALNVWLPLPQALVLLVLALMLLRRREL